MSIEFDPYEKWLGIPREDQPPNHYRLLGLTLYESDSQLITAAADERMKMIRSYQTGPRGAFTQRLLNELAAARLCLLNPATKAAYDQQLQFESYSELPPVVELPPGQDFAPAPYVVPQPTSQPHQQPASANVRFELQTDLEPVDSGTMMLSSALVLLVLAGAAAGGAWWWSKSRPAPIVVTTPPIMESITPVETEKSEDNSPPVVVMQEGSGSIRLTPFVARIKGEQLVLAEFRDRDAITKWTSNEDQAVWRFKAVKLPSQGIFHVLVEYAASGNAGGAQVQIGAGGEPRTMAIRSNGEIVQDEIYLAVPNAGEHDFTLRVLNLPDETEVAITGVTLQLAKPTAPMPESQ